MLYFGGTPTKLGSTRFIAIGPDVVLECGLANATSPLINVESSTLLELQEIEIRNCFCGSTNGPIGAINVTTVRLTSVTAVNNYAQFGGGVMFTKNVDNVIISNSIFRGNEGTNTLKAFFERYSAVWWCFIV